MKRFVRVVPIVLIAAVAACDLPFELMDRPAYDNPADPASRVPIEKVIARIEAENPDPQPLVDAILRTGARYNDEVHELGFDNVNDPLPVADLTGITYLPKLERLYLFNGGGAIAPDLSVLGGHTSMRQICVADFDAAVIESIPTLGRLRTLELTVIGGAGVDFSAMQPQSLHTLNAGDAGISTLSGIERLGPIGELDIRGAFNTFPDADLVNELPVLADSLQSINTRIPAGGVGFLSSLPNITGVGFDIGGPLTDTFVASVTAYPGIERFGAYDVSAIASLVELNVSGFVDLEIHMSAAVAIDLFDIRNMPLVAINLSGFSGITGIADLADTVERIHFIDSGLTDSGAELETIAASFPNLRVLDISHNPGVTSLQPIAINAATMANVEEVIANQYAFGAPPVTPWGVSDANPGNGIADLVFLPRLQFLSIRNSYAAYQLIVNNVNIGIATLYQFFGDSIGIDAVSEDA
jgi:hypothetical protein